MRKLSQDVSLTRYWFEHDARNDLWIGRITHRGEEVCVVVGSTRGEVMSSARLSYIEIVSQAA